MNEVRTLKKHANRRLYDTELKKYVSLVQIRDLINTGIDVQIEDSKSGEDITRPILLQIMAECEQDDSPMLSPAMLMTLIRHYGHPMQDFLGPFLEKSVAFYMRQEARLRQRMTDLVESRVSKKKEKSDNKESAADAFTSMRDNLMQVLKSAKRD